MIPAEIVFLESPDGDRWAARFVAPLASVRDVRYRGAGDAVRPRWACIITRTASGFQVFTRGGGTGSERRYTFATLDDAQRWAMAWAARRYRVTA